METVRAKPNGLWVIIQSANPVFVILAMGLPIGGLIYALNTNSLTPINYVHIMTGALWTGIDLFMGLILGPVVGGMEPGERASLFKRLTPKMTFLMPVVAGVAVTAGINLALRLGFPLTSPRVLIALIIVAVLTVQGFGILLPNEIRILRELLSKTPDTEKISRLGMRNARLGGIQGALQLAIIFMMAIIRF